MGLFEQNYKTPEDFTQKLERVVFDNGDVYEGEMVNGLHHGKGKYTYASGNYYDGEWVNGKYHGHGIYHWSDGDEFEGEWKNGKRHGEGKWTYADGRYYTGVWENGESVSSTSIVYPSASKATPKATKSKSRIQYEHSYYEGETKDDEPHGKGVYVWDNGTRYEGDFFEGNITGNGVVYYTNGDKYEGELKDGQRHGSGKWIYSNGDYYTGVWYSGKREGIFERYVYDEDNTYNLSSYIIYENDEEKRRYIARAMQDEGITTKEDVLRYHKEQTSPKAKTATSSASTKSSSSNAQKTVEGDLPIGTIIPTKTDIDNYYGPYSITGAGKAPDGEGKLYEYDDPLGECTYEHVGEWRDGKRHGIFVRNKNTRGWKDLELYSFDVYFQGMLKERFYASDMAKEGVYTKAQFQDYYAAYRTKNAKVIIDENPSSTANEYDPFEADRRKEEQKSRERERIRREEDAKRKERARIDEERRRERERERAYDEALRRQIAETKRQEAEAALRRLLNK